jgi:hypothetical protein
MQVELSPIGLGESRERGLVAGSHSGNKCRGLVRIRLDAQTIKVAVLNSGT